MNKQQYTKMSNEIEKYQGHKAWGSDAEFEIAETFRKEFSNEIKEYYQITERMISGKLTLEQAI